jgi:UDP-N-acetyl-2-amino-2-deoxyglucuronate dehydrogenase
MSGPLRFGIVGCGTISSTHGDCLRKLETEGVARMVAAADIDEKRASAFGTKYGVPTVTTLADLLSRDDIDVVTICTPSGLHAEMAIQTAKAGKHILSEKPLDVWIDPVDRAIAAAKAAGVVYGGIFQERFSPAAQKVKRAVTSGAFGEIVLSCAETKWYRSQGYYDSGAWRGTWALDAGVFSNQGIHSLDKVQWLAGPVVEVLSATLCPGFHRTIESETLGVATVRYENGALGTITMTTLAFDGFPERVDVSGTSGSAMLVGDTLAHFKTVAPYEDTAATTAPVAPEADDAGDKASNPAALWADNHLQNIRDFALAVRDGREPSVSATEARRAVALLNMIYEKAKVGPYA